MVLKIFVGTLRPFLEDLEEWLSNATLPSTHQEFFIRQGAFHVHCSPLKSMRAPASLILEPFSLLTDLGM